MQQDVHRSRGSDNRRVPEDKAILCLRMLLEGNSVRSTQRLTGVHRDTILEAMVPLGKDCKRFLESKISGIAVPTSKPMNCGRSWG